MGRSVNFVFFILLFVCNSCQFFNQKEEDLAISEKNQDLISIDNTDLSFNSSLIELPHEEQTGIPVLSGPLTLQPINSLGGGGLILNQPPLTGGSAQLSNGGGTLVLNQPGGGTLSTFVNDSQIIAENCEKYKNSNFTGPYSVEEEKIAEDCRKRWESISELEAIERQYDLDTLVQDSNIELLRCNSLEVMERINSEFKVYSDQLSGGNQSDDSSGDGAYSSDFSSSSYTYDYNSSSSAAANYVDAEDQIKLLKEDLVNNGLNLKCQNENNSEFLKHFEFHDFLSTQFAVDLLNQSLEDLSNLPGDPESYFTTIEIETLVESYNNRYFKYIEKYAVQQQGLAQTSNINNRIKNVAEVIFQNLGNFFISSAYADSETDGGQCGTKNKFLSGLKKFFIGLFRLRRKDIENGDKIVQIDTTEKVGYLAGTAITRVCPIAGHVINAVPTYRGIMLVLYKLTGASKLLKAAHVEIMTKGDEGCCGANTCDSSDPNSSCYQGQQ